MIAIGFQQAFQGGLDVHQFGLSTLSCLILFLLPLDLPRLRFFDSFLALLAAFLHNVHLLCHLQLIQTRSFYIHQRKGEICQAQRDPLLDTGE
jgi:hypothetical protein